MSGMRLGMAALAAMAALALGAGPAAGKEKPAPGSKNTLLGTSYFAVAPTMRPGRMLDAASAKGSPGYHRHLVRPGGLTSYLLRLRNDGSAAAEIRLAVEGAAPGWEVALAQSAVPLGPGETRYVKLTLRPGASLAPGAVAALKIRATSNAGAAEEIVVEAETTAKHKLYYLSIDSLGPEYVALNQAATGPGRNGDWLMPNLHRFLAAGVFYPRHQAHLPAATDMNHLSYLTGVYPGRLGIYSVQVLMFGFEPKGWAIWRSTPHDVMYWGADGKPVTTVFNVVKDPAAGGNTSAFTAFVSSKDWVPEHLRNPIFGLDRIATVTDYPDYITPPARVPKPSESIRDMLEERTHKLNKPDFALWEDVYAADQALAVIDNEDPDVAYILLGGVDEAGHFFGAGKDPSEWNDRGTADLSDDISRINRDGNREGIIRTVRNADEQLGRLLAALSARGADRDAIIVVESDHNMETNSFTGPRLQKVMPKSGLSKKTDYYAFTGSQLGFIFLRRDDPALALKLEQTIEAWRWKDPVTGAEECPVIVLDRAEMKTGIDTATGAQVTPPMELYSEYYIEHPQPGGMRWPDLFLFPRANLQFPSIGAGFGNIGLGVLPFDVPPFTVYVGGHAAPSTRPALLAIKGPGLPAGIVSDALTHPSDVAPTLDRLEGYRIPECVQGQVLPGSEPSPP